MSLAAGSANSSSSPVRVCIVQQIVPHYRVPVFDLLARQPGIELSVWSGHQPWGSLQPAKGTGRYEEVDAPFKKYGLVYWQPGQVAAAKAAAAGRYDLVIFSWNARLVHLPRALRVCARSGVPALLWGHGFSKGESRWKRRVRNRLLDSAAAVLLYNQHAADRLVREGIDRSRIFVAFNAIDQGPIRAAREHWLARPQDLAGFREERDIVEGAMALFISRLEQDKRIDLLLDAFAIVAMRRPTARLAIIGRGGAEAALRAQAARLGLDKHVIFAGSVYDDMHLAPWFLTAACMAYPVAIGLSVLHAFGYGLPVVTSDDTTSHNPEIESLRAGENGLLYRDGDAGDFAAKMLTCMSDAALRARLREGALATVRSPDGFCIERMVRGFTDAIAFAMQTSQRPAVQTSR